MSTIQVSTASKPITIYAKMLDSTGRVFRLEADPIDPILDIAHSIQEKTGIPPSMLRILYKNEQIYCANFLPFRTLGEFGIKHGDEVRFAVGFHGGFPACAERPAEEEEKEDSKQETVVVYAKVLCGNKTHRFEALPSTPIGEIAKMVEEKDGIPTSSQLIRYKGKQVYCATFEDPLKTLEELGVELDKEINFVVGAHAAVGSGSMSTKDLKRKKRAELKKQLRDRQRRGDGEGGDE